MTDRADASSGQSHPHNAPNPFGITGYRPDSYGDAFADVYDTWYDSLDDDDFVDLMCASLPQHGVRILELGVGTGRLVNAIARRRPGISDEMWGIDSSSAMLDIARHNVSSSVHLVQGDFSQSLPDGPFDAIFVGYNTLFNVADEAALRACLELVAQRLAATGEFFVDVVTSPQHPGGDHVGIRSMGTDEVVLSISRHDPDTQHITGQFVQFTDGQPLRLRPWAIRYFSPTQLDECAYACGLHLHRRLGDGYGQPFDPNAARHISTYVLPQSS